MKLVKQGTYLIVMLDTPVRSVPISKTEIQNKPLPFLLAGTYGNPYKPSFYAFYFVDNELVREKCLNETVDWYTNPIYNYLISCKLKDILV